MSDYTRLRTPFTSMSFTPDVPSNALGPTEYNNGLNVEADVRGVKKINGEDQILSAVPGNTIFVDANYRDQTTFVYIVATREGRWYKVATTGITNITPGYGANPSVALSGYNDDLNITTSWVGGVFFINDTLRPPMYYRPTDTEIQIYGSAPDDFVWNYGSGVNATRAGFMRNFCSPNVGNILIAGNLTQDLDTSVTVNYPTTVRWSQAFANTGVPATWEPTLTNIANEQEVPVRGPLIDGFFLGGNFYVCSYWDTVVFSPIAYQSSTAPIFGVRLFNQGRGLLNNNCCVNTDQAVYGVDSRDIWVFDGSNFNSLGNQRVRNYFFSNLSPTYQNRLFMVNNTQKYQIEIYYPDLNSTGWCNKMLSYRYDLQVWNAPKDIEGACHGCEAPVYNADEADFMYATRCVTYAQGSTASAQLIQTGQGNSFIDNAPIPALFERNNLVLQSERGPVPYSSKVYIHRALPEIAGTGNVDITIGGANSTAQDPTYGQTGIVSIVTDNPWVTTQQNAVRTVSIKVESNDATNAWNMTAMNWQASVVEDAF
jgi:hypothetical protein